MSLNVVLCTGIMRSGSTWSYNVARVLFHVAATKTGAEEHSQYMDRGDLDRWLMANIEAPNIAAVIKSHYTDTMARVMIREGRIKNICTVRDPRDCVASRRHFKNETIATSLSLIKESFDDAMRYESNTLYVLYDHLMERPALEIARIAEHLMIRLKDAIYRELATEIGIAQMRKEQESLPVNPKAVVAHDALVDPVTLLHANHIDSGRIGRYKKDFDRETAHFVSHELRNEIAWFKGMRKALC